MTSRSCGRALSFFLQFAGIDTECAWDGFRIGFKIQRMPQIEDGKFLAVIDLFFQILDADPGDAKITQEFLPGQKFVYRM